MYKRNHLRFSNKKMKGISTLFIILILFLSNNIIFETIAPTYEYMYRFKHVFSSTSFFSILPFLFLISFFTNRQINRGSYSDFFVSIINLLYYLPSMTMICYGNFSPLYNIFHLCGFISLSIINEIFPHISNRKEIKVPILQQSQITTMTISLALVAILIVVYYNGFNISISMDNIYQLRKEWANSSMPNIFNYFLPYAARIIPILLVIFICKKKHFISSLLILSQLILFSFGGLKYTFFALLLSIIFSKLIKINSIKKSILWGLISMNAIAFIEIQIYGNSILATYINRRISYIPNQIGYYYFDFFSKEGYLFYSNSFLRNLLEYPYSMNVPHTVASYAFNLPQMGANTGLIVEGFSQIGWLSIIIYPILYIFSFRIYEFCVRGFQDKTIGVKAAMFGTILYTLSFIDGAFFSILLTQGFILTQITLLLLSRSRIKL